MGPRSTDTGTHWDEVYGAKSAEEVSWFQRDPEVSLRLVAAVPGSLVDVGAGASLLVDRLLAAGRTDLTLLDVSSTALEVTRNRLGSAAGQVTFAVADVLTWAPGRTFDCWHDRAVFHFLTNPTHKANYVQCAARLVAPGGAVVLGTFAADGPTSCSGLPTARYSSADLAAEFAEAFTLEHTEQETHRTPWGAEQRFTWLVLRHR